MKGIGVVSLVDDPPRIARRGLSVARRLPRRAVVEVGRDPQGFGRGVLRDGDDALDTPPAIVARLASGRALGAKRELPGPVACILCAGGIGPHQDGARACGGMPGDASVCVDLRVVAVECMTRESNRACKLLAMTVPPAWQV